MVETMQTNFVKKYQPGAKAIVELKNARFTDVLNGCFFDQGTSVVIKDGKIASMPGPSGEALDLKPDYCIDLKGKTVMPGLFNVHCHIQMVRPTIFLNCKAIRAQKKFQKQQIEKNMSDCLQRGVTNIRDAYTEDLRLNRLLKNRIRNGVIPGPRIQQAVVVGALGGYLTPELRGLRKILLRFLGSGKTEYEDGHSGVVVFPYKANVRQVRDAINKAIDERGADLIKVGESLEVSWINSNPNIMSTEQLNAIADQAQYRGLQSTIHSVSVDTFRRAVKAGFSSLAHMARDNDLNKKDVEDCLNSGCIIEPTLSVGYDMSWKLNGDPFFNDPNMKKIYEFRNRTFIDLVSEFWMPQLANHAIAGYKKATLGQYNVFGLINLKKLLKHFSRLIHFGVENSKLLLEAGVSMACGNDGGIQACTPAMIGHELEIFNLFMNDTKTGNKFSPATALKTATLNSAKSMGIDHKFGTIQPGKIADLVVIDGDPFQDSSIIGKRVDALFMDGILKIDNCGLEILRFAQK